MCVKVAAGQPYVLRAVWAAWRARDIAGVLALAADDVFYPFYVPHDVLPFGGETVGKAALADRLRMRIDMFDILNYKGIVTGTDGVTVRGHVTYHFRHRFTGEDNAGTMRQVVQVRDGLVSTFKTYVDADGVRAFMSMVSQTAADERALRDDDSRRSVV